MFCGTTPAQFRILMMQMRHRIAKFLQLQGYIITKSFQIGLLYYLNLHTSRAIQSDSALRRHISGGFHGSRHKHSGFHL